MSRLTRSKSAGSRDALFKRDPHCHWCGAVTITPSRCEQGNPRMATLDHIKSRLQCTTKQEYRSGNNKVLACLKCNAERDRKFWLEEKPWIAEAEKHKFQRRIVHVPVPPELSAAYDAALPA